MGQQAPALTTVPSALAREHGLPEWPGFPDTGLTFERLEKAGFPSNEAVRTVAQRRPFTREATSVTSPPARSTH